MGISETNLPARHPIDSHAAPTFSHPVSESHEELDSSRGNDASTYPADPSRPPRSNAMMLFATDVITSLFLLIWLSLCGIMLFRKRAMWRAGAAASAFGMVSLISESMSVRFIPAIKALSGRRLNLWHNTVMSYCHSLTTAVGVFAVFAVDFGTFGKGKGMYRGHSSRAYTVVSISCGYLAYDLWDSLRRRLYNPKAPSILAHNAILLVCFTIALYRDVTINYLILTLVCETNSIFLHHRRLLSLAGVSSCGWVNWINWKCLWITYFGTRIVAHGIIPPLLIYNYRSFPRGVEFPIALGGILCFNLLNLELGRDLIKAHRREEKAHVGNIVQAKVAID